jgi:hypothetical protein
MGMANDGSAESTMVVSVSLMPGSRVRSRQLGIHATIFLARKSSVLAGSLLSDSGKPRYVWGNVEMENPRIATRVASKVAWNRYGVRRVREDFAMA